MTSTLRIVVSVSFPALAAAVIFASAGRFDLPMVWGVLGVLAFYVVVMFAVIDPALLRERMKPGPGNRDRLTRPLTVAMLFAHWVVTGLDVGRFHWSPIPWPVQLAGLIGYAVAMAGVMWAVRANPFYSSVVRLQSDRGQRPVTAGPYRFVRHPGYTATVLGMFCGGLALGSWVGMLPLLFTAAVFVRRTLVEDAMLRRELAGYADYAQRVRYRLLVGVF
jgi:protein-S-isoprenylcysteine O-methyltransferase Ste14